MSDFTHITNAHPEYIDNMYTSFKENPNNVEDKWKQFFEGFDFAVNGAMEETQEGSISPKEFKVFSLIEGYRTRGHLIADTNPIRPRKDRHPSLKIEDFGLAKADLKEKFSVGSIIGLNNVSLQQIIDKLQSIYCKHVGVEYMYISDVKIIDWFKDKFESGKRANFSIDKKKRILQKLNGAVGFENFLHKKYIGQKRFSLEGGETAIPALDAIINKSAELGTKEVVIGMAHRGRLNVLANIMGKTYEHLFNEFEGLADPDLTMGDGDVKYHLGYSSLVKTPTDKEVHLKLTPNPSHLEAVDPVVGGFTRGKADTLYGSDYDKILPILIHGDASVAGQGIVYEVAQMSKLKGYYVGGTIHLVINNQIGFTTTFDDARSSNYCTSIASTIGAPVIHVNGDSVEDAIWAVELATEYRNKFNKDIYIDMVCYRKHGHNEGDDPKFTQPTFYDLINKHKNPREIYAAQLAASGEIGAEVAKAMDKEFWDVLQQRLDLVKQKPLKYVYQEAELAWKSLKKKVTHTDFEKSPKTSITKKKVTDIVKNIHSIPEDFHALRKVKKLMNTKLKMLENDTLDWSMGELLAYSSLLEEGHDVRMSGQDVKRGTFSHRHAVLFDEENDAEYNRLNHIKKDQGEFIIYNSLLSEFAVLGFEFGYGLANPNSLVVWEAQFGDFVNGAQTMIDQFITSSESKWQRQNGLVMLLPHGYEGQGPEHSSARLERFLQSCAEFNITVANCTTPASLFHILRRQLKRPFRKPLVIMAPKSLLRHPKCVSKVADFTKGEFKEIIDDALTAKNASKVKRVLCCSGKIYYDLLEKQTADKREDVAIVRLEQLYPMPKNQLQAIMKQYSNAKEVVWVQEEPSNMGAWQYMLAINRDVRWDLISRKSSASPATGYNKVHLKEQEEIIERAFDLKNATFNI